MFREKEIRVKINDIQEFKNKIEKLGAKLTVRYSLLDYVCRPQHCPWNPHFINLKIRVQEAGDKKGIIEMSFHKSVWKNNIKITKLGFKTSLDIPRKKIPEFIKLMGLKIIAKYSRSGEHYKLGEYDFTIEKINHLGYMMEIEELKLKQLYSIERALKVDKKDIIKKSVPEMVLEKLGKS